MIECTKLRMKYAIWKFINKDIIFVAEAFKSMLMKYLCMHRPIQNVCDCAYSLHVSKLVLYLQSLNTSSF